MPSYEYACAKCGKFEHFQRMTDDPLTECPTCGAPVKRLISKNVGIIFKGSGFYITDTRNQSSNGKSSGTDTSNAKSSTSNEEKSA